jgi:hypothetical protein
MDAHHHRPSRWDPYGVEPEPEPAPGGRAERGVARWWWGVVLTALACFTLGFALPTGAAAWA